MPQRWIYEPEGGTPWPPPTKHTKLGSAHLPHEDRLLPKGTDVGFGVASRSVDLNQPMGLEARALPE